MTVALVGGRCTPMKAVSYARLSRQVLVDFTSYGVRFRVTFVTSRVTHSAKLPSSLKLPIDKRDGLVDAEVAGDDRCA